MASLVLPAAAEALKERQLAIDVLKCERPTIQNAMEDEFKQVSEMLRGGWGVRGKGHAKAS